jgi:hypothetical protein
MKTTKCSVLAVVSFFVICVVAGCGSSVGVPDAARCANNWKKQGYEFDPNSMNCSQMFRRAQAIRRANHWRMNGHYFDPNSMTASQMDETAMNINRARYWMEKKGYIFYPDSMTAWEMDLRAEELDKSAEKLPKRMGASSASSSYIKGRIRLQPPAEGRQGNIDLPAAARRWEVFETTSIDGWVKRVKRGTIFKTISGNIYEVVGAVILLELELRPDVTVLTDGRIYKLSIQGVDEPLLCRKLNRSNPPHPRPQPRLEPAEPCYVWTMTK